MRYRVTTACFDVTKNPPEPVQVTGGNVLEGSNHLLSVEIIDTETNEIFESCEDVNHIEDTVLEFWNRLNPSCIDPPHYTHNPNSKVVVVDCRPATGKDLTLTLPGD